MLWVKAFHIVFMVTWFAGLFYLPRLFVYHADCTDGPGHARFRIMETRLFILMTLGALLTAVFGFWLLFEYAWAAWGDAWWLHAKLAAVAMLAVYHTWCWFLMRALAAGRNRHSARWLKWFNEVPTVLLVVIVALAVLKPT